MNSELPGPSQSDLATSPGATETARLSVYKILDERFAPLQALNSPNDLIGAEDDAVWFTDASYGIDGDYEGMRAESEIGACNVYRVDPLTGRCHLAADGFERPTRIAFSAGERHRYVADSRRNHIRVFDLDDRQRLVRDRVLVEGTVPSLDSMRVDSDGRLWIRRPATHPPVHLRVNARPVHHAPRHRPPCLTPR